MNSSAKCSLMEQYMAARHRSGLFTNFYVACQLNRDVCNGDLLPVVVQLVREIPHMSCSVVGDDIRQIDVDVEKCIEHWNGGYEMNTELINKVLTWKPPLDSDLPTWKIIVVNKRLVFLCASHVLFDGMSLVNIWNRLLELLNGAVPNEPYKLQSPLYHQLKFPWTFFFKFVLGEILPAWVYPSNWGKQRLLYVFSQFKVRADMGNTNQQCVLNIPEQRMKRMREQCREHGISLHSFLLAMTCQSFEDIVCGRDIAFQFPINLRPILKQSFSSIPKDYDSRFGNHIKGSEYRINVTGREFWDIADEMQKTVTEMINNDDGLKMLTLLRAVGVENYVNSSFGKTPGSLFEISNLGLQFNKVQGPWQVENAWFNTPASTHNLFTAHTISTATGGINMTFNFPHVAEQLMTESIRRCNDIIDGI